MTGCAECRMQAGGRNIDRAGSLQEAAVMRGRPMWGRPVPGRPVVETDETVGKAQAAGRGGRGRGSRVPSFPLPAAPPGESR